MCRRGSFQPGIDDRRDAALASPGTIAEYCKDGHFPDGTVLVKEVFNTTTKI
jgi:hypothetical protein